MEPENGDGRALRRFIALFVGGGRHDLDVCAHAPADESRRAAPQPKVQAQMRHAADCPAENDDVVICTCGALYRLVAASVDDNGASALALAKIV